MIAHLAFVDEKDLLHSAEILLGPESNVSDVDPDLRFGRHVLLLSAAVQE